MRFTAGRALIVLLRVQGFVELLALVAVVMPYSWMGEVHRAMGMGDLPSDPITEYLARSLSGFYAFHGAVLIAFSLDLPRYLPLVRLFGWMGVAAGIGLFAMDHAIGMPAFWVLGEGPIVVALSGAMVWLAYRSRP